MEKLVQALSFGGVLSERDIEIVANSFRIKELKSGEYFQESGNPADKIVLVEKGILRVYRRDEKGNDVTKYFKRENLFFADMISYYSAQPGLNETGKPRISISSNASFTSLFLLTLDNFALIYRLAKTMVAYLRYFFLNMTIIIGCL